jgi:hypothetical protein
MSIADHFDPAPDAGFVRSYDCHAARRQFQVSLVLILTLTLAAFALGFLLQFDPPTGAGRPPLHEVHFASNRTDLRG